MAEVATNDPAVILGEARALVDARLERCAERMERSVPGVLGEALGYALRSPGKRVRPALLLASYRAAGGVGSGIAGIATAVEIVHTYSLVHDDLPCMDDDQLRRGRATTHVAFDVATASRVGFALVPVAAEELSQSAHELDLDTSVLGAIASELFEAGGIRGMVGGQWLDLEAEGRQLDLEGLRAVHRAKTGALIGAAVTIGALAAQASAPVLAALKAFGDDVGLAFQVADDVLDATRTSAELGKTAGKDAEVAKSTYVGLLGVAAAREKADMLARSAIAALAPAGVPDVKLAALARYIVDRES